MTKERIYNLSDVIPYINWIYFFHAWGIPPVYAHVADIGVDEDSRKRWLQTFSAEEAAKAEAAATLFDEAMLALNEMGNTRSTRAKFALLQATSCDDDIHIVTDDGRNVTFPFLRQQHTHSANSTPNLCLSDFIKPACKGQPDTIGMFAATVNPAEEEPETDAYRVMMQQTLCDRLAEATAEKMHEEVRKTYWGYAKDENLSVKDLHSERFQGIRPAVGYPSLPDQSIIFLINDILRMESIGIHLTENGAMQPHATVCGLMFAHPQSRYFGIGKIGHDQLEDYAKRRGLPLETMRKFLNANL